MAWILPRKFIYKINIDHFQQIFQFLANKPYKIITPQKGESNTQYKCDGFMGMKCS